MRLAAALVIAGCVDSRSAGARLVRVSLSRRLDGAARSHRDVVPGVRARGRRVHSVSAGAGARQRRWHVRDRGRARWAVPAPAQRGRVLRRVHAARRPRVRRALGRPRAARRSARRYRGAARARRERARRVAGRRRPVRRLLRQRERGRRSGSEPPAGAGRDGDPGDVRLGARVLVGCQQRRISDGSRRGRRARGRARERARRRRPPHVGGDAGAHRTGADAGRRAALAGDRRVRRRHTRCNAERDRAGDQLAATLEPGVTPVDQGIVVVTGPGTSTGELLGPSSRARRPARRTRR